MAKSITVLLIDDNPSDLFLAQEAFSGYHDQVTVVSHSDGGEALAYLRDTLQPLPNVIVLDVNMPGMSGFDVLKAIRADLTLRHLPVVMLSTSADEKDINTAYDLISSSYIVKNPHFDQFARQIDSFVRFWLESQFKRTQRTSVNDL
ncbi:response regulator [Deinococcus knuensis]|uniref:Response regulator n=1 Tax=Deinococcus knuensis TaxID=1837380 RepID=A0ABQ2SEK4_9DEIO|nr:response regulator [Deinococcus knuensis]GGS25596.1 response regulator [Deinococcus knuensis]